jgi:tetratricopeptide (TPR) repeat protein
MQACILSLKRVVAAAPAAATYQLSLAQAYCTLGSFELRRSASAPALAAYARALETLEPLRRKDASEARVRFFLVSAYLGCGQASSQLGRYPEAIEYGTRTLEVVSAERKPMIRYYRAKAMMGAAQYEQAVAELDDLLRPDPGTKWTPDQLCDFAGMYSAASTVIQSRKGELQDKAVALLEEAIARGLTLTAVRGNANLRYLSQHPGYQILLNAK